MTITRERKRPTGGPEELMDYLLSSLGFRRNREIYRKILIKLIHNRSLSSGVIARGTAKRTTAIYHLSKLVDAGLVIKRGSHYELRGRTLREAIEELERDITNILNELKEVAEKIDKMVGRW